jgi:hypothetical protein
MRQNFIKYMLMDLSAKIVTNDINKTSFRNLFDKAIPTIYTTHNYKSMGVIPIYFSHTTEDDTVDNIGCLVFHWYLQIDDNVATRVHGFSHCRFSGIQELNEVLEWIEHTNAPISLPSPMEEMSSSLYYNHVLSFKEQEA